VNGDDKGRPDKANKLKRDEAIEMDQAQQERQTNDSQMKPSGDSCCSDSGDGAWRLAPPGVVRVRQLHP